MTGNRPGRGGRSLWGFVAAAVAAVVLSERAAAHSGSLGGSVASATVPTWLTVLTGGIVVGGSFLFTTLLTDHDAMRGVNWWRLALPTPARLRRAVVPFVRACSVGVLLLVVVTGFAGPREGVRNFALLVVWVGWWAGYTATTYLVGDTWPALNPWRAPLSAVRWVRSRRRRGEDGDGGDADRGDDSLVGSVSLPVSWGVWPAVAGLLALVWLEVVSPVGENPRLLAGVVLAYTLVTVAGSLLVGEGWFERVDPVSRVFAAYGRVAPLQRDADGSLTVRLPGTALTEDPLPERPGEVAFVVALLWVTTYDGLVATPTWAAAVEPVVDAGVPALAVYAVVLLAGFGLFLAVYRLAARKVRATAGTYVTARAIERWFAPALLPIAAGYHLAHFLGYFLGLAPALAAVATSPFAPPASPLALVLPGWFGSVKLLFVLGGHVLAIWVAHSLAFELFPGVLAAIRSQYPSVVVMVFYTMTSLWVITQPYAPPPYV
ncbi:hypothetical protein [Halosimplex pelagicum]|uniref:Uncharacterized protein n=1 Tax=Halosimplex pelagicum TaxID=869886 RepID=A0A7D5PBU6_9EURY|nr:hypothetical protein [Halosimplex pelagicum]QLH82542.1 hypothetical protein HZS54_13355 [Halosimplex pelagicum]